eukprot:CAMPEP_0182928788 /NCGR_PEP_ID=MMETSP0105_2-20130417/17467_1 /TAXON_ID=81532 ORGANISM="Acanthoeca-like sp., Strain 10tr" /NCGR_SAMPLE_ID=MMETSP0105_2 /ASSEMBLY_ACC=CAM_ASM_000205 /LENGTH=47 /DNA_ID= /DNA_START= /DNA_END= /DNA_ORIENTATION=
MLACRFAMKAACIIGAIASVVHAAVPSVLLQNAADQNVRMPAAGLGT